MNRKQRSPEERKRLLLVGQVGLLRSKIDAGKTLKAALYEVVGTSGHRDALDQHEKQLRAIYRYLQRLARR